jgi:hypothetical protein
MVDDPDPGPSLGPVLCKPLRVLGEPEVYE